MHHHQTIKILQEATMNEHFHAVAFNKIIQGLAFCQEPQDLEKLVDSSINLLQTLKSSNSWDQQKVYLEFKAFLIGFTWTIAEGSWNVSNEFPFLTEIKHWEQCLVLLVSLLLHIYPIEWDGIGLASFQPEIDSIAFELALNVSRETFARDEMLKFLALSKNEAVCMLIGERIVNEKVQNSNLVELESESRAMKMDNEDKISKFMNLLREKHLLLEELKKDPQLFSFLLSQPFSHWDLSLEDFSSLSWQHLQQNAAFLFLDDRYFSVNALETLENNRRKMLDLITEQLFQHSNVIACEFVVKAMEKHENLGIFPLKLLIMLLEGCLERTLARSICLNIIDSISKDILLLLFMKYSSILFPLVFQSFFANENFFNLICSSIGFSLQKFIDKGLLSLFPSLFFTRNESQELQTLSKLKGIDYATFFISNIHILIAHVFIGYESQEKFDSNLKLIIEEVSKLSGSVVGIHDILKANFQDVLRVIFLLFAGMEENQSKDQVEKKKKTLNSIAKIVLPEVFSSNAISQLLRRCFLGIFYALNEEIKNSSLCDYERFIYMNALYEMMICVSNADLNTYLAHIVPLIESTCAVFCDSCLFSPLLSRFWSHLLPLVNCEDANLAEFLIFFQKTPSKDFENFLATHRENPKISLLFFENFSQSGEEIFQILTELLRNKFEIVHEFALNVFLKYFQSSYSRHSMASNSVSASKLISCQKALFSLCRNPKLRPKACEVFSFLGFVEEEALSGELASPSLSKVFHVEYLESKQNILDYSSNLIETFLLPHFKSSRELAFQDRLAFVIQELCRIVGFSSLVHHDRSCLSSMKPLDLNGYESAVAERWETFDSLVRENLLPFLKAKYTIHLPKFTSSKGKSSADIVSSSSFSYKEWIFVFYSNCLEKISCPLKVEFFSPFRAIINSELQIIPQILSCLLLCLLQDVQNRNENAQYILGEFNGIFAFLSRLDALSPAQKRVIDILFSVIDSQRSWIKNSIRTGYQSMVKKTNPYANPWLPAVRRIEQDFFSCLDRKSACLIAFKIGNIKRALMFLEIESQDSHDESSKHQFISDNYSLLKSIYSSLNAKAELKEIIRYFHRDTKDMLIIHQMENDWRNCLSIVQSHSSNEAELDRCLYMLGMDEVILTKNEKITEYAARSIINLQRWDLIPSEAAQSKDFSAPLELGKKILSKSFDLNDAYIPDDFVATSFNMSLYDDLYHFADLQAKRSRIINFDNYDKMFGYHLSIDKAQDQSKIWLERAKRARKANLFDLAKNSLLRIPNQLHSPAIIMEKARILWHQGDKLEALHLVKSGQEIVPVKFNSSTATANASESDYLKGKVCRLVAKWMDELQIDNSGQVLKKIREAIYLDERSEKGHYMFAKYYYKLYLNQLEKTHSIQDLNAFIVGTNYAVNVIRSFARALLTGTKFIYESIPRLLNIWLDVSAKYYGKYRAVHDQTLDEMISKMEKTIEKLFTKLSPWQFYIGLSLLIARFNQPSDNTAELVSRMLIVLLQAYPDQTMWFLFSQARSSNNVRKGKFYEILGKLKSTKGIGPEFLVRINQCLGFFEALLQISNYIPTEKNHSGFNLSSIKEFKYLNQRMFPLQWIIPLTESLVPTLPEDYSCNSQWNPFPLLEHSQITCIKDSIEVLNSLQRPKKITLCSASGKEYEFLCKPKDDLRTDARVMEFFTLVNKFCYKERITKDLGIHTYCVLPLNEECGIIEWVPRTVCYRTAVNSIYALKGIEIPNREELVKIFELKLPLVEIFTQKLLPRFPTQFAEWFTFQFGHDSIAWWSSKQAYTKTLATMSMVGAILGLGDRHGENIMLDECTGKVVHVDFNCLFEKGLKFAKPEKVPFRMTHNIESALGILGCQGTFKEICIQVLGVMRSNRDLLLSNLETFIHDPIIDFSKRKPNSCINEVEEALRCVSVVGKKLKGHIDDGLPLSVEGQVEELIKMATDLQNLSEMFIGWAAYM